MIFAPLLILAAIGDVSMPAIAPTLEPAFDSTIVSTYPDGRSSKLWLNRDGTFTAQERDRVNKGGRWSIKSGALCLRQTKPFPIPFLAYCSPIPSSGLTAAWSGKAITGEPIVIRLAPGRQAEAQASRLSETR